MQARLNRSGDQVLVDGRTCGDSTMRHVFIALLALSVLSACTATIEPPKAKIVVPSISTSPGFCPPGQAKKGNC
jgi:hypothetical protein